MCGIVGYIGPKNAVDIIIEGLSRLEYRGYDSAGLSVFSDKNKQLEIYKETGKLLNLKNKIKGKSLRAHCGIGHTRWATHGGVTLENAHPHGDHNMAIVHNGIIENSDELKAELSAEGYGLNSETDSEVFFLLVKKYYTECESLKMAVSKAFTRVKGNSAFVVIDKTGQQILTVKKSAPIVCGDNDEVMESFVSSDPYALVGYVKRLYFPEDEVLCVLKSSDKKFQAFELDGTPSKRYVTKDQNIEHTVVDKGEYDHFMIKEIFEQPVLIRNWIKYYLEGEGKKLLARLKDEHPTRIYIVACGTAWHAGIVISHFIEKYNRIPTQVELASEFRYKNPIFLPGDIAFFISQSGETADTLAAQELCEKQGVKTFSIVNVEGSTLYRNCDQNYIIKAGIEIGVASSKAFTLQALTGYLISMAFRDHLNESELIEKIEDFSVKLENLFDEKELIQSIAKDVYTKKGYIFTGRGIYFPIALEGALKLKEIAYVHAEGYAAGELKHGPIALIDEEMVNIALVGPELFDKSFSNLEEVMARRGIVIAIGDKDNHDKFDRCNYFIPLDMSKEDDFHPLYSNVVLQLFAYYLAKEKGTDIDKPRNLAKSVTVE